MYRIHVRFLQAAPGQGGRGQAPRTLIHNLVTRMRPAIIVFTKLLPNYELP